MRKYKAMPNCYCMTLRAGLESCVYFEEDGRIGIVPPADALIPLPMNSPQRTALRILLHATRSPTQAVQYYQDYACNVLRLIESLPWDTDDQAIGAWIVEQEKQRAV